MNANRYGVAQQRLERLAERWTNDGEVLVLLGECAGRRSRPLGEADDRSPPGRRFRPRARSSPVPPCSGRHT